VTSAGPGWFEARNDGDRPKMLADPGFKPRFNLFNAAAPAEKRQGLN
jgi:hypothetical protein